MQEVFPTLRITDEARSRAFSCDGLGFTVDWEHRFEPGLPLFLQIRHDGRSLSLSQHTGDCQVGGLVYLYVSDVDAWYAAACDNGLPVDGPPTKQPWGLRDFRVTDPDGNQLNIGTRSPVTTERACSDEPPLCSPEALDISREVQPWLG